MWRHAVVGSHGAVVGVVTDRDLSSEGPSETHRTAEHIAVCYAMSQPVLSCVPDENLKEMLATMLTHQGVLSIDDIVQVPRRRGTPTAEEIVDAFRGIGAPRAIETAIA